MVKKLIVEPYLSFTLVAQSESHVVGATHSAKIIDMLIRTTYADKIFAERRHACSVITGMERISAIKQAAS